MSTSTETALSRKQWALLIIIALLAIVPRLFFLSVPFERDEGAYAYVSDVILGGGLPYIDAFDHKPPGIYYIYAAASQIFGHTLQAPRIMAAIFVFAACLATGYATWLITADFIMSLMALPLLGIVSSSLAYTGYNANTEIFTLPFIAGALCFVLRGDKKTENAFVAGLFLGVGFIIKQPIVLIAAAGGVGLWLSWKRSSIKELSYLLGSYAFGVILPLTLVILFFLLEGQFDGFWKGFWQYNVEYVGGPSASMAFSAFLNNFLRIMSMDPMTWGIGYLGIILYIGSRNPTRHRTVFLLFFTAAFAAVAMGKNFFTHYFVFLLPFLAIGNVLLLEQVTKGCSLFKKLTIATALFAFVALPLIVDAQLSPKRILEKAYGGALPFYQSVNVGKFLKTTAKGNRKALIIGSEPQIYYYSGMKAPSSFFYYYPIQQETKMKPGIRSTFLRDISLQVPDYLIFVNSFTSHFIQSPSADEFYRQIRSFFTEYKLIGVSRYDIEKIVTDPAPLHDKSFVLAPGALLIFERNGLSSGQDGPALSSFIINKPR